MALDPALIADFPYDPSGVFFDEVLDIDHEQSVIRLRMPTHAGLPLTSAQRAHPLKHPRHVNGGLMVHVSGMAAFAHAYYLLGLRHSEGWIGYGANIRFLRYPALARIGEPLVLEVRAARVRRGRDRVIVIYRYEFRQGDAVVYESEQTAVYVRHAAAEAQTARGEEEQAHP